jgi:hypothetical protein
MFGIDVSFIYPDLMVKNREAPMRGTLSGGPIPNWCESGTNYFSFYYLEYDVIKING